MCGIVGHATLAPVSNGGWLANACDALRHRGPDGGRVWRSADGRVGLGHRRLAIIDLSPAASQPMRRGELAIAFNGEIYNFVDLRAELEAAGVAFRTHSDTEVILAAYDRWGFDCLSRLNGMFAFALHDAARGVLFLARDRAGEKPLFYRATGTSIAFASELKSLLIDPSQPREVDRPALDCYLSMGFVPGDRSILSGVRKLPPAHALAFDLSTGDARVWRYWQLPEFEAAPADDDALLDELDALLQDAVHRQLVADVPVGILLSGGVDSSLVTAMASRSRRGVKTFTIRFPGADRHDETEHARLIARHFGTDHAELVAEPSTAELLPQLARQFDEPVNDSSMIPTYLVSRLIREHCTVALGGDGGDELFGGYAHYNRLLELERRSAALPRALQRAIAAAGDALPPGFKGRNWLQALKADLRADLPLIACYFDPASRRRLLGSADSSPAPADLAWREATPRGGDLLQRATRADFQTYLPEDILVKVDRASMLTSLEVRAPLLDHRIVEFAFGRVPSHLKATTSGRKILLKKLAERLLPPSFDKRRKQGFSIPMSQWLQSGPWLSFFKAVLLDPGQTLFDRREVARLFDGQARGRANGERLFGLVMFELWRKTYGVSA
jgi:asparagine synthase (glutamine-hydrolysing)